MYSIKPMKKPERFVQLVNSPKLLTLFSLAFLFIESGLYAIFEKKNEAELRHPRYVGPIFYKINSVEDRSWTYYDWMNLSKKDWSYGERGIRSPLDISALDTGIRESFPRPVIEISLCKK